MNLFAMTFVWLTASFNYFVLSFLVATFCDTMFEVGISLGIADILAFGIAGYVYEKVGVKVSLVSAFSIATLAGVLILIFGLKNQDSMGFVFLVFLALLMVFFLCVVYVYLHRLF